MSAITTDSYGIDTKRGSRSRFTAIIEDAIEDASDRIAVALYGHYILNTSPGYRPSDAAARAVSHFRANPEAIRSRESGMPPVL